MANLRQSFVFVPQAPGDVQQQRAKEKFARKHAIRHSLRQKRLMHGVFRHQKSTNQSHVSNVPNFTPAPVLPPIGSPVDPFHALPVKSDRLVALLSHQSAPQAGRPVFSYNNGYTWQHLRRVFGAGVQDPAVSNAVALSIAFAANGDRLDRECEIFRVGAIENVHARLPTLCSASASVLIGAILLLIGVEAKLGATAVAQIHLDGLSQLLSVATQNDIHIKPGMKRAMFWQDLEVSVIASTRRVFHHNSFPEIQWIGDLPYDNRPHAIPVGFRRRLTLLGQELLDIMADKRRFRAQREGRASGEISMLALDNRRGQLESRLQLLQNKAGLKPPLWTTCIWAAYLCVHVLFTDSWSCDLIPQTISLRIFNLLQYVVPMEAWDGNNDLLLWTMCCGAASATSSTAMGDFAGLWTSKFSGRLSHFRSNEAHLLHTLESLCWPGNVFNSGCAVFLRTLQDRH